MARDTVKSGHQMSPVVRRAFSLALSRIAGAERGKESALADIIEEQLKENPIATLSVLAKYEVKETLNRNINELESLTDDELNRRLETLLAAHRARANESSGRDGQESEVEQASELQTIQ